MRKLILGSLVVTVLCIGSCTAVVVVATVKGAVALQRASIEAALELSK